MGCSLSCKEDHATQHMNKGCEVWGGEGFGAAYQSKKDVAIN